MLTIKSIPAFQDNYIWLIQNSEQQCFVVDPGDANPVLRYLEQHDLHLLGVLITHHHADHTGGVAELLAHFPNTPIYGPKESRFQSISHPLEDGEQLKVLGETFLVVGLAGHTLDHIGYVGDGKVFCGDTLFSAGCGRVFEGTMEQMHQALNLLAALPLETQVYCTHEYTSANVAFAMAVEPENQELGFYRDEVNRLRAQNQPTLPTTIGLEKTINPFLRTDLPEVVKAVSHLTSSTDSLSVFSALRQWKNDF